MGTINEDLVHCDLSVIEKELTDAGMKIASEEDVAANKKAMAEYEEKRLTA